MKGILFLAFFISFVVFLMSASLLFYYTTPISKSSFQASATITKDIGGFDLNSTALTFGSIALGGSSTRSILISNPYSFPVRVKPVVEGSISDLVVYSPLTIEPHNSSSFRISVFSKSNNLIGNYTGNISILLIPLS